MLRHRYAAYGALFGLCFPIIGTVVEALTRFRQLPFGQALGRAQGSMLMWIIDTAPLFLGVFASLAGAANDRLAEGFSRTAKEVQASASALLSTVSALSSQSTETAASVRQTAATMTQLSHSATQAALTAETVIGLAHSAETASAQGRRAAESSSQELAQLSTEVGRLAACVQALGTRMREVSGITAVVSYLADRSRGLAEEASNALRQGGGPEAMGALVRELAAHAQHARGAAAKVGAAMEEAQRATVAAAAAAQVASQRASRGAQVALESNEAIQRLAAALGDSSRAGKQIATVAQEQDHGIDQVLKAVNEVYQAAQETMSSTHDVAAQARSLSVVAGDLQNAAAVARA